jgi:hypothetical protein
MSRTSKHIYISKSFPQSITKILLSIFLGPGCMFLSVILGIIIASPIFGGGREAFIGVVVFTPILIIFFGAMMYYFGWCSRLGYFLTFIPAELIIIYMIAYFSGISFFDFDDFFMTWLLHVNLAVLLPWFIGYIVAEWYIKRHKV